MAECNFLYLNAVSSVVEQINWTAQLVFEILCQRVQSPENEPSFENQWIAPRQARMAVAWMLREKSGKPRVPPDSQFLPAHRDSHFRASPGDAGATRAPEDAPNLALPQCDSESELDSPRLAKKDMGAGAICFDI